MPLSEYRGPANSPEMFQHMVGEKIAATFMDKHGHVWVVLSSGYAVVFAASGTSFPTYWPTPPAEVEREVSARRSELAALAGQLRDLGPMPRAGAKPDRGGSGG